MLRDIESKLAGLVEGTFGRLFRSEVTPAEIARGLVREMEATRRQGLDRTWVAHRYDVYLSPTDHERIIALGPTLNEELSNHLLVHAREQRFALAHAPEVSFHRGAELPPSRYGVAALHDEPPAAAPAPAPVAEEPRRVQRTGPSEPVRREPPAPAAPPARRPRAAAADRLALLLEGRRELLPASGGTIGRSRECDVVIASAEVSRRHCRIAPGPDGWTIEDLGSTNGVRVGGIAVPAGTAATIAPGDRIELGTVVLRVEDGR
ncbi:DUF3662 and FHA domain-containing protein [Patulibacter defluvii]|uniref:DUF3662 and FHA domain-containing protein n=1 Tax=Patulibacter defluvii TaxID=3095358 RepID=UPI002A756288|nr:DUF3662 and FHA domain-containing protein [Patulibacter sp. DM4]